MTIKKTIVKILIVSFLLWYIFYIALTPLTWKSLGFRWWLIFLVSLPVMKIFIKFLINQKGHSYSQSKKLSSKDRNVNLYGFGSALLFLIIMVIIMQISASTMFNATKHRNLITVTEGPKFEDSIENIDNMIIPIVDKDFAAKLGDKRLGEEKGLGSQFHIGNYSIIEQNGKLYWVAPLEYNGLFKWLSKKDEGVPGYIKVSATNPSDVEFVETNMKYLQSAYFGQDLYRHVYAKYPTVLLSNDYYFELDDQDNPYIIIDTLNRTINASSGLNVKGVIIIDTISGAMKHYQVDDVPQWVDRNIPASLIMDQLDQWGRLVHGWTNTWTSKTEMLQVSENYNFIYNNGNFYLMTGLTSVGSDESIVGITLTNMNSKETTFYQIGGATEWAAQQSAQGVVQDLGYSASFPILVNYNGIPTYFMTLKDSEGLIKKYAYVNIKDYSVVGVGNTIMDAKTNYLKNISSNNNDILNNQLKTITGTINKIKEVSIDGTTYYNILLDDMPNNVFIAQYSVSLELPFTEVGDQVTIEYYETQSSSISIQTIDNLNLTIGE